MKAAFFRPSALALGVAVAGVAGFQSLDAQAEGPALVLEEVTVTARRRAESMQDVPISVTAFSENTLALKGMLGVEDIARAVPSLHYANRGNSQTDITIRGIGGNSRNIGIESGVGLYIDGVYAGRSGGYNADLAQIEQIEVLRGPQGTLFGKNTIGGAVNITTKKPSQETQASLFSSAGNLNAIRTKFSLSGGLSDTVSAGITVGTWTRDGYIKNVVDGKKLMEEDRLSGRVQLRITPNDDLDINLAYEMTSDADRPYLLNQYVDTSAVGSNIREVAQDKPSTDKRDMDGASATIDYRINDSYSVKSVTGYRTVDLLAFSDVDSHNGPANVFSGPFAEESEQLTQEFQLSFAGDGLSYIAGLYYYNLDIKDDKQISVGAPIPLAALDNNQETESWAVFVNADFNLSDSLILTLGARYTDEEKNANYSQNKNGGIFPRWVFDGLKFSDSNTSFTSSLKFEVSDEVSIYGTVSSGFKSGGFNLDVNTANVTTDTIVFDSEDVMTYESGFKSVWGGGATRINGAIFYIDYSDQQIAATRLVEFGGQTTGSTIVTNAGASSVKGIELEIDSLLSESLQLRASFSYLDAEYDEYLNGPVGVPSTLDLSGQTLDRTPEMSATLDLTHTLPLSDGEIISNLSAAYTGETHLNIEDENKAIAAGGDPKFHIQDGFSTLDARVGFRSAGDWGVYLWAKNLTDEEFRHFSRNFFGLQTLYSVPRTYGIEFRWDM